MTGPSGRGRRRGANVFSGPAGTWWGGSGSSNHSRRSTPSIGTAASRPPVASTIAAPPDVAGFGASASSDRASATASTVPRRLATPSRGAGAPGTVPITSSFITSRVSRTSTASVRPPMATTHARRRWAPGRIASGGSVGSGAGVPSGDGAASGTTASSAGKPAHHAQQLVRRERFREVLVGALLLAPRAVALLVPRRDEHHGRLAGARVAAQRPQDLVAVAAGHDDVEEQHVGMLGLHLVLERFAVAERDDLMAGAAQDRLHELQVGIGVVDHHHLRHRTEPPCQSGVGAEKCNGSATAGRGRPGGARGRAAPQTPPGRARAGCHAGPPPRAHPGPATH